MSSPPPELEARDAARREAISTVLVAGGVLVLLASASWNGGWELVDVPWWSWLVLAVPGLLLCANLWLGARGAGLVGRRTASLVLLELIVAGNGTGGCLLGRARGLARTDERGGGRPLAT